MKRTGKFLLAITGACAMLAACGIRGDLERPPPIFSDPPDEEAQKPVDVPARAQASEKSQDEAYMNELGGEIPKSDPAADIGEDGMGEVEPG